MCPLVTHHTLHITAKGLSHYIQCPQHVRTIDISHTGIATVPVTIDTVSPKWARYSYCHYLIRPARIKPPLKGSGLKLSYWCPCPATWLMYLTYINADLNITSAYRGSHPMPAQYVVSVSNLLFGHKI